MRSPQPSRKRKGAGPFLHWRKGLDQWGEEARKKGNPTFKNEGSSRCTQKGGFTTCSTKENSLTLFLYFTILIPNLLHPSISDLRLWFKIFISPPSHKRIPSSLSTFHREHILLAWCLHNCHGEPEAYCIFLKEKRWRPTAIEKRDYYIHNVNLRPTGVKAHDGESLGNF